MNEHPLATARDADLLQLNHPIHDLLFLLLRHRREIFRHGRFHPIGPRIVQYLQQILLRPLGLGRDSDERGEYRRPSPLSPWQAAQFSA